MISNKLNYIYELCGISNNQNKSNSEIIKSFFLDKQHMLTLRNQRRLEKILNLLHDHDLSDDDYQFLQEICNHKTLQNNKLFLKVKSNNTNYSDRNFYQISKIINFKSPNKIIPEVNYSNKTIIFFKKK